ncbi:Response regulator PleD [Zhongshania aliphaticivorans]|uniref:diguanylate cyclase n=1 Tax=Zhongshania aliphaticivorans TaxID=1470434 RepID=A0A5S9NB87_9GAMM|nr:sensor domain-containing diguanylate cyclase [Zhongshania aliphaticivorans]CAA0078747.1 Response regulator PleD [Zhongshania aliphaticivorans]CAA0086541.1 Response regulator PleD [Zhongshania aliphaticivorans]
MKTRILPPDSNVATNFADHFIGGLMVSDEHRHIIFTNSYFKQELDWEDSHLLGKNINTLFSGASQIFFDTYLFPIISIEGQCEETQVTLLKGNGERLPVVIYVRSSPDKDGLLYWTIVPSTNRDKLYNELISNRERLEAQAERLNSLATVDELTGVNNRRELMRLSETLLDQAIRSSREVALLFIDIDYFKVINDTHGHAYGDLALKQLGKILNEFGRSSDIIGRYGGEEFIIVFPDASRDAAQRYAERIHKLVEKIHLTVSIGVSQIKASNATPLDVLVESADKALYQAKSAGRNRTVFSDNIQGSHA